MTARAEVRNSAENPPTATRVAGSEPLKMMTPRSPLPQPLPEDCMRVLPCGWWSELERPAGGGVTITCKLSNAQQQKTAKTTPCTVDRGCKINDLRGAE